MEDMEVDRFVYSNTTKAYFGNGIAQEALPLELKDVGSVVMLAYGCGAIKENGIYDEIRGILDDAGKTVIDFPGIMSNPTYSKVQGGASLARKRNVDFILAVGGGSVIDCCKMISAQAKSDEDVWDMEFRRREKPSTSIPLGAVVTVSGTGAEMNSGAVITHEEKKWKGGMIGRAASFAILDPSYTASVPPMQVMSGAFDTLSHAMETFLGLSDEGNVSDDLALAVMKNTVSNMRRLQIDINDMGARSNLMWDSALAESGILKCGRSTDFQAHQIEHQLAAFTDCNHGQGLAVIQMAYYRHILSNAVDKFARIAETLFHVPDAGAGLRELESFIKKCGLPTRLSELRTKTEITPELLRQVADTTTIVRTGPRKLGRGEIFEILTECM